MTTADDGCLDAGTEAWTSHVGETRPLTEIPDGQEAVIARIESGRCAATRLCHLGLTPGTVVEKVYSAPWGGPVKLRVRGSTIAIGRCIAERLLVVQASR